jgi:hypothetical protein
MSDDNTNAALKQSVDATCKLIETLVDGKYRQSLIDEQDEEDQNWAEAEDYEVVDQFIEDHILDFRFVVGRDLDYIDVQACMTFGGPNIWMNTEGAQVDGYWGSSHVTGNISYDARDILRDAFEHIYDTLRQQ